MKKVVGILAIVGVLSSFGVQANYYHDPNNDMIRSEFLYPGGDRFLGVGVDHFYNADHVRDAANHVKKTRGVK